MLLLSLKKQQHLHPCGSELLPTPGGNIPREFLVTVDKEDLEELWSCSLRIKTVSFIYLFIYLTFSCTGSLLLHTAFL